MKQYTNKNLFVIFLDANQHTTLCRGRFKFRWPLKKKEKNQFLWSCLVQGERVKYISGLDSYPVNEFIICINWSIFSVWDTMPRPVRLPGLPGVQLRPPRLPAPPSQGRRQSKKNSQLTGISVRKGEGSIPVLNHITGLFPRKILILSVTGGGGGG